MASILSWIFTILIAVFAFGMLVLIHELGHFAAARRSGMRVERFSLGFGPVIWSRKRGETEWCLSLVPIGGYVQIAGMAAGESIDPKDRSAYANQPSWRRLLVIVAGPAMNYVAAVVLATALIATMGFQEADLRAVTGRIAPGGAAARAGLMPGDLIQSIGGKPVDSWSALVTEVRAHPGQEVELLVLRGSEQVRLTARPDDMNGVGRMGIGPGMVTLRAGPVQAMVLGVRLTNDKAVEVVSGLGQVLARKQKAEFSGPIGIAQEMAKSAQEGASSFFQFVWFISVVLAIFNLLPFPALDGGRLVFLIYELTTRRRVNQRVESYVHMAGFVVLLGLLFAVTVFGDLARLFRR